MEGTPEHIVCHWATEKARNIAGLYPDRPVLGADTMVFENGDLLGKPDSPEEAFSMVERLSGTWHTVFGGVALVWHTRGLFFTFAEATRVKFRALSHNETRAYVESGEPMDKAGAYGIQGLGCVLVERVEGCYFNVMGLPVAQFLHRFRESL